MKSIKKHGVVFTWACDCDINKDKRKMKSKNGSGFADTEYIPLDKDGNSYFTELQLLTPWKWKKKDDIKASIMLFMLDAKGTEDKQFIL